MKIKQVGPQQTPVKELLVVANKKLISKYWSEKISFVYYCLRSLIFYKQKKSILFLWIWWEFSSVTSWIDWTNLILYWNSKNFQVLEWNWMLNAKWCDTFSIIEVALRHWRLPNYKPCWQGKSTCEERPGIFHIFKESLKVQALKGGYRKN